MQTNIRDLSLKQKLFAYEGPASVPLSFRWGDRQVRGIPEDFEVTVSRRAMGADLTLYDIVATHESGLELKLEYREYADFAVTEWLAELSNRGTRPTEILSKIRMEGLLPLPLETLYHGNGDLHRHGGYRWQTDSLPQTLSPDMGVSCSGAFPYMRLLGEDLGVNLAIGWTGRWVAELAAAEGGVSISVGQARSHSRLLPGETFRTPRLTLQGYTGSEDRGRNAWRRWYFKYILPREKGQPLKPLCCMHYFKEGGYPEFTGATEAGQTGAIDRYLERGIHPDVLWMDAGWYPCDHSWRLLGDWRPDPERFPNGLRPIGQKCAEKDIRYLLWFEPERAVDGTPFVKEHPQWMLDAPVTGERQSDNRLVNLGDPECLRYVTDLVDGIIKEGGVNVYRQDFNFDPYPRWVHNEAQDRVGALENLHIQGYYRFWDALLERNPGLWIDSCASGGRRNDLETMRRSVPLHYTDVGYGMHPTKQLQHRQMFEWIPYFRAHVWSWDDPVTGEYADHGKVEHPVDEYAFYCALTPAITDMLYHEDSEERFALSRKMQPIWRRAAELMLTCDYYPLTVCRESREDFYAMAFYSAERGEGFLNVVSNNQNKERQFVARLTMLEQKETYVRTEAETGRSLTLTGAELHEGFAVEMEPRSGVIWFICRS